MKEKVIFFIYAHPDDEAFCASGSIYQLAKKNKVYVISLCRGNRPGYEEEEGSRKKSFTESNEVLGSIPIIFDNDDTNLGFNEARKSIELLIHKYNPEVVYTHSHSDIHRDHRVVSEATMVAVRPTPENSVNEVYSTEHISSTDWSFDFDGSGLFSPNTYVEMDQESMDIKTKVLEFYSTELREYPDSRSIESMNILSQYRGKQVGVKNAEAFKLIFKRIRKPNE